MPGAQVYRVGGAVRDQLLGLPVQDNDWVVVGATPDQMLAQGFVPVGKDFPVFLHPASKEEYALARTERKTAPGYTGFAVHFASDVTLEQDLARRDLTINAIAQAPDGSLHDPYHGQRDLRERVLRHVTAAFAEDPVRILRVARFAARYGDFSVAPETMQLMQSMVAAGETDHLVPERSWQEISRGLMEQRPSRMIRVLRESGALARVLPEVDALFGIPQRAEYHPEIDTGEHLLLVLDMAAQLQAPLPVRYACLCHDLGKATTPTHLLPRHLGHEQRSAALLQPMSVRLRVPNDCRELAHVVAKEHGNIHRSSDLNAAATVRLLERCDAFRQPARFAQVLLACECDARGRLGFQDQPYPQRPHLWQALQSLQTLDLGAIAHGVTQEVQARAQGHSPNRSSPASAPSPSATSVGERIRRRIHQARVRQLQASSLCAPDDAQRNIDPNPEPSP
ncbi:MAG: multifunctional CCA addition/repair protein [Brachymonas sp.]|nr:multifunctional CCA addition/repair protein [Brachymonas sp.]